MDKNERDLFLATSMSIGSMAVEFCRQPEMISVFRAWMEERRVHGEAEDLVTDEIMFNTDYNLTMAAGAIFDRLGVTRRRHLRAVPEPSADPVVVP